MDYTDLSDESKISLAIEFVAIGQPLPDALASWLRDNGLYDLITKPGFNAGLPDGNA